MFYVSTRFAVNTNEIVVFYLKSETELAIELKSGREVIVMDDNAVELFNNLIKEMKKQIE